MFDDAILSKKEVLLAYIAGIFDGEGCVSVHKKGNSFALQVVVEMRDSQAIKAISNKFGGKIRICNNKKKNCITRKVSYCTKRALKFLKAICPFLRVKKQQAKIAISMLEYQKKTKDPFLTRKNKFEKWAKDCKILKKKDWILA